jgi:hypothetical protein
MRFAILIAVVGALCCSGCSTLPTAHLNQWSIEQRPGGIVTVRDRALVIEDAAGCTAWLREKLVAPVVIEYDVTAVAHGGPHDRVSDVNCFWMASDPTAADGCPFAPGHARSGKFEELGMHFTPPATTNCGRSNASPTTGGHQWSKVHNQFSRFPLPRTRD